MLQFRKRFMTGSAMLVALGIALAGCGDSNDDKNDASASPELVTVKMVPGFAPHGNVANLTGGIDQGFFRKEGINLEIVIPSSTSDALKLVATNESDLALVNGFNQIIARSQGVPIRSIATTIQRTNHGIMTRAEDKLASLKDLEGKTVGMTGFEGNRAALNAILEREGVDVSKVKFVTVNFTGATMLAQKRVDALGDASDFSVPISYNSLTDKSPGDTSNYNYLPYKDFGGTRYYSLNWATNDKFLEKENGDVARRFLRAWQASTQWAIDNPEEAAATAVKKFPDLKLPAVTEQWRVIGASAQSEETEEHGLGWQDMSVFSGMEDFLFENKIIEKEVDVPEFATNDYLPKK